MGKVKLTLDLISEEKRKEAINEIIDFFKTERDEEIGVIAAENILDFFLESVGKEVYNKGVKDSVFLLRERIGSLELDIESLLRK